MERIGVTSFSWGPDWVPVQGPSGNSTECSTPRSLLNGQHSSPCSTSTTFSLPADAGPSGKMQWRDAAVVQQQRLVQGDFEYRFVVLVQDDDE